VSRAAVTGADLRARSRTQRSGSIAMSASAHPVCVQGRSERQITMAEGSTRSSEKTPATS
jgi:hypothetical protein